jgi:hypothetical protein
VPSWMGWPPGNFRCHKNFFSLFPICVRTAGALQLNSHESLKIYIERYGTTMVSLVVKFSHHPRWPGPPRHRGEKSVTASSLESAFTTVTRVFFLECAVTETPGFISLLALFCHFLHQECLPTPYRSKASTLFHKNAGVSPSPRHPCLKCYFNSARFGSSCSPRASREPRQGALASYSAQLYSRSIAPAKRRVILNPALSRSWRT